MILAQLSDLHIRPEGRTPPGRRDTSETLAAAVADLRNPAIRPDAVLLTGDLTEDGLAEEYGLLRELLSPLTCPVFLMPGNHDRREQMRAAFPDHGYLGEGDGPIHYAIEDFPVRLIALDSMVPGQSGGRLGAEQIAWLDGCLGEQPDRTTIVALHHPPFPSGVFGLEDSEVLAAVIRRHPQIERVIAGHGHLTAQVRWAGTAVFTALAIAHQFELDFRKGATVRLNMEPAGYHFHFLTEHGLVTSTRLIGPWREAPPAKQNPE